MCVRPSVERPQVAPETAPAPGGERRQFSLPRLSGNAELIWPQSEPSALTARDDDDDDDGDDVDGLS